MEERIDAALVPPPGTGVASGLTDFRGCWNVRRLVVDHLSGTTHRFAGKVIISASEFSESGEMRYGSVSLKSQRGYLLRDEDQSLAVAFADGRSFIQLDGRPSQAVHHLCGDDDYHGRFFFRSADAWVEAWRVSGPRKRYASLAHYRRASD